MEEFIREVFEQSERLGLDGFQRLVLLIVVAVLMVASKYAGAAVLSALKGIWTHLRSIEIKEEPDPSPPMDVPPPPRDREWEP